ncbi:conserved hypothetical protein [Citreicella sp. SE45]|nr:conserved hypothetical protein [Citreicella sp. SE45]
MTESDFIWILILVLTAAALTLYLRSGHRTPARRGGDGRTHEAPEDARPSGPPEVWVADLQSSLPPMPRITSRRGARAAAAELDGDDEGDAPAHAHAPAPAPAKDGCTTRYWVQRVFFGTDRAVEAMDEHGADFGNRRAGRLTLGHTDITIPREAHREGRIERPTEYGFFSVTLRRKACDPEHHFTVLKTEILSEPAFMAMASHVAEGAERFAHTAFVFIHGFNTTFADATFRAAQLAHDLGFDGPAFAYSWPSDGETQDYASDLESARNAGGFMDRFLELVFETPGVEKVHVIAHSMGNAALEALLTRAGTRLGQRGQAIGQLVLAAPDLDAGSFETMAGHFTAAAKGITLYACASDRALLASQQGLDTHRRLGDVGPDGPVVVQGIDSIDVTPVGSDLFSLNRNAYAQDRGLLDDLGALFSTGQRPPGRRLSKLTEVAGPRGIYWRMAR